MSAEVLASQAQQEPVQQREPEPEPEQPQQQPEAPVVAAAAPAAAPAEEKEEKEESQPTPVPYTIEVITSDQRGAGTDANVKCILYGPEGERTPLTDAPLEAPLQPRLRLPHGQPLPCKGAPVESAAGAAALHSHPHLAPVCKQASLGPSRWTTRAATLSAAARTLSP